MTIMRKQREKLAGYENGVRLFANYKRRSCSFICTRSVVDFVNFYEIYVYCEN